MDPPTHQMVRHSSWEDFDQASISIFCPCMSSQKFGVFRWPTFLLPLKIVCLAFMFQVILTMLCFPCYEFCDFQDSMSHFCEFSDSRVYSGRNRGPPRISSEAAGWGHHRQLWRYLVFKQLSKKFTTLGKHLFECCDRFPRISNESMRNRSPINFHPSVY